MGGHDDYGKRLLWEATGGAVEQYGPPIEIDYGAGQPRAQQPLRVTLPPLPNRNTPLVIRNMEYHGVK